MISICALVAAVAMIGKSAGIRKFAAAVAARASRDTILPPGNSNYFCETDCHIAYSIPDPSV